MRVLLVTFLLFSSIFAKGIYFEGGKMNLQDLALTVSLETNKEILISQNIKDRVVYLRVGKVISKNKLFDYFKVLLDANGLSLNHKKGFYLVSAITDLKSLIYRFKYRKAQDFKPFIKRYKSLCSLGNNLLFCNLKPKQYNNLVKLVKRYDIAIPKDPYRNRTLEIKLKIFESNFNDLYNLQNSLTFNTTTKPLQIDSSLSKSLNLALGLFLGGSSVLNTASLGFVFDYLKQKGLSTIINEPTILVTNNHSSSITTGGTQRVISSTSKTQDLTAETTNYEEFVSGLQLTIKAHIINDNLYNLNISFNNEDVIGGTPELPITSKQSYSTNITLTKDKTFILGGVIYNKISKQNNSVPFISKIPILGIPFKNTSDTKEKKVLTIAITVKALR